MNDIPLADILAFGVIAACIVMSMIRGVIAEAGFAVCVGDFLFVG